MTGVLSLGTELLILFLLYSRHKDRFIRHVETIIKPINGFIEHTSRFIKMSGRKIPSFYYKSERGYEKERIKVILLRIAIALIILGILAILGLFI